MFARKFQIIGNWKFACKHHNFHLEICQTDRDGFRQRGALGHLTFWGPKTWSARMLFF